MPVGRTLWNRRVAARDGVELAADVILPAGDGPWPALVNRTPYSRVSALRPDSWIRLVDDGYALVAFDVRGRGDSDGTFTPHVHDAADGYDAIEWVASQPWCTGRVGTVGISYDALTQWWAAKAKPPHLRCIVPQAVGAVSLGPRWSSDTGVPSQYRIWWYHLVTGRTQQHPGAPSWEANYGHVPLRELHEQVGTAREWWPEYVAGTIGPMGPEQTLSSSEWDVFDVPALVGVGWWDDLNTIATWMALRSSPAGPGSRLLIGAWDHAGNRAPRPVLGGVDVSASVLDVFAYVERFLAFHLKEERSSLDGLPRCNVFRTGQMCWEALEDWPSPDAVPDPWHLDADRVLSQELSGQDGADSYVYDPRDPPRDLVNLDTFAWSDPPLDKRYLLRRRDVLAFTSRPLRKRVDVSGQAVFEGIVSVDAPDTDLLVTLYDVCPDGRSLVLGGLPAIQRLAYRDGPDPDLLNPGEPVLVRIPVTWLHHSFLTGHCIRLSIASAAFPQYARNFNTGEPWADASEPRVARVTVHYGLDQPSRIILPVERVMGSR